VTLDVDVPRLRLELPESSTRNVQSLDEVSTIQTSRPLGPPAQKRDADAFEWAMAVSLGDVRAGSSGVDVRVRTLEDAPLSLVLSDELRTRGEIVLAGGEVELNKRRFEIDRGIIRLREEDAGNPYVNVTAHVDVGDGSVIYVDYVGLLSPITDEKIRFRSDPPRSQAEIVSLLLFGDTTASPGAGSVVGSVGGTVATALANELLAQSIFRTSRSTSAPPRRAATCRPPCRSATASGSISRSAPSSSRERVRWAPRVARRVRRAATSVSTTASPSAGRCAPGAGSATPKQKTCAPASASTPCGSTPTETSSTLGLRTPSDSAQLAQAAFCQTTT
jgi:hypothetical protein